VIDAGRCASSGPVAAVAALRVAGASLADIGAACGVTGEAVRGWAAGVDPGPVRRAALLDALRRVVA